MPPVATAAVVVATVLDVVCEELPERLHPVVWYGRVIEVLDRSWAYPRIVGAIIAIMMPGLAAGISAIVVLEAVRINPIVGAFVAGGILFTVTSLRRLISTAVDVIQLSETDVQAARDLLPALVGRDPTSLSGSEIRSAAVESVAENLADGLVGPLIAFSFLAWQSLPLAIGVAVWVKAVNTGDSMLGYKTKPVGLASAKLDDLVMWMPARITALLLALTALDPLAVRRAHKWAGNPPSPNAGWPMATLAEILGVRLTKPGVYSLGSGDLPTTKIAHRGVRITGLAGGLTFLGTGVVVWF